MHEAIQECLDLRTAASKIIADNYAYLGLTTELELADKLILNLAKLPNVLNSGWYDPPIKGVSVLYSSPQDNFARSRFDTLRNQAYWPSGFRRHSDGIAIIYVSPVTESGIIGDWGGTFYTGTDTKIKNHIKQCLSVVEELADYSEVGMEYGEISRRADKLLDGHGLTTERTVLINGRGATGTNCGHTIPFTNVTLSDMELESSIIASKNQKAINDLISSSRTFINTSETSKIPPTTAFTTELRLESIDYPDLPNVFFHLIVSFINGEKRVVSNYTQMFKHLGMDYIQPRF